MERNSGILLHAKIINHANHTPPDRLNVVWYSFKAESHFNKYSHCTWRWHKIFTELNLHVNDFKDVKKTRLSPQFPHMTKWLNNKPSGFTGHARVYFVDWPDPATFLNIPRSENYAKWSHFDFIEHPIPYFLQHYDGTCKGFGWVIMAYCHAVILTLLSHKSINACLPLDHFTTRN